MRKKLCFLLFILFTSISVSGQIADGITYQAVALDDKGKEIAGHDINGLIIHSKQISVRFSILSGSPEGELLYKEVHSTYTDPHGLFTLVIGHGDVSPDGLHQKLTDINWGADKLFLMVEIDIRSKGDYKVMGIQQMMAVPFAFHSLSSSTIKYDDILNSPTLSTVATTGNYLDLVNLPVTFDGNYDNLSNKPFIPVKTSDLDNDAGFLKDFTEMDPVWVAASANYYTGSDLQTAGASRIHFLNITNRPTTLAGYGITDAMSKSSPANSISTSNISNWNMAFSWGNHTGLYRLSTWIPAWNEITANPFTITSPSNNQLLRYNSSTGKWQNWTPNYLTGYTETDPLWSSASVNYYTKTNLQSSGSALVHFNNIISRPTTITGYGITDAMRTSHPANNITGTNIANWNNAFTWGSHIGLYRPVTWVPSWNDLAANPFTITAPANNQILKYNSATGKWQNWTPDFLTYYAESDPVFMAWNKSTGITISSSQVNDFQESVTNNPVVITNSTKNSYPVADAEKLVGIAPGAEVNVNADWNATSGDAQILNKPTLATVATSGIYSDLYGLPTIPTQYTDAMADLRVVSGITGKVDKIAGMGLSTNDYTTAERNKLAGIASGAEVNVNADWNAAGGDAQILNKPTLSAVAITGIFTDLNQVPTTLTGYGITDAMGISSPAYGITSTHISNWDTAFSWGNHANVGYTILPSHTGNNGKFLSTNGSTLSWNSLSAVALSGNYNDLINKPLLNGSETRVIAGSNVIVTGTGTNTNPYIVSSSGGGSGGFTHYIGEQYGGGVVFHVYRDALGQEHGLIVSIYEQGYAPWGLGGYDVPDCESTWNGLANTTAIVNSGCLATDEIGRASCRERV